MADQVVTVISLGDTRHEPAPHDGNALGAMLSTAGVVILILDRQGRVVRVNRTSESIVPGAVPAQPEGPFWELFVAPAERHRVVAWFAELRAGGRVGSIEVPCPPGTGPQRLVRWTVSGVDVGLAGADSILCMGEDVTAQRAEARALQASEARHRLIAHEFPGVVVLFDHDLRFIHATGRQMRSSATMQPESLVGRTLHEALGSDAAVLEPHYRAALAGRTVEFEVRRNGRLHSARAVPVLGPDGLVTHGMVLSQDVTDLRAAQERLQQTDRLSSLGALAAGMGHEINNPLTYVMANIAMAREVLASGGAGADAAALREADGMLREALQGADRVATIVRQLKAFSRAPECSPDASSDVAHAVDAALAMVGNQIRHRARLVRADGPVPPARIDEGRLVQVLINLLVNAVQATPEGNAAHHEIRIRTSAAADGPIVLEVSDTGTGIADADLPRIFEPFFTTRQVGQGTGLGLSICYSIITAAGGRISVTTAPGQGSTFHVSLQRARAAPAPRPVAQEPAPPPGRVLVIDDEVMVARSLERVLKPHAVTTCTDPRDALGLLAGPEVFDLVLCDLMMPVMSGADLHAELTQRAPHLAAGIVFMTGGAFTPNTTEFLRRIPNLCLEKPLDPDTLRGLVAERVKRRARG